MCKKFQYFSEFKKTLDQNNKEIPALLPNLRRGDLSKREKEEKRVRTWKTNLLIKFLNLNVKISFIIAFLEMVTVEKKKS